MRAQRARFTDQPIWDESLLTDAGVPIHDTHFVTVGGGLGSFAMADFLRIAGLETSQIRVLSNLSTPYETFAALAAASQLGPDDRLRSDSSSRIDNIWGWPGYALTEAWKERTLAPLWRVLAEPLLAEYFTPRVRTVIDGVEREAARIGWDEMLVPAWAELVRRRAGGGYFVLVRLAGNDAIVAYRCQHVHLALGHPGPRVLPDAIAFRRRYRRAGHVVNAYQPHEHVYERLLRSPGVVVVRGSGITASRILERLIQDRGRGAETRILHLFRRYVDGPAGPPWFRRGGGDGFAFQPFNFPRAAGGGQLRQRMLSMSGSERARLTAAMGGTTTAPRRQWQLQLARGRREGWYRAEEAVVVNLCVNASGRLTLQLSRKGQEERWSVDADFLIDATGLDDDVGRHSLLADLLDVGGASLNALGRLDVEPNFELCRMRSGAGRLYATGAATLGGALAPVDSFWGLTHAAMEIVDDLAGQGTCEFPGMGRSITQWWRYMRNERP